MIESSFLSSHSSYLDSEEFKTEWPFPELSSYLDGDYSCNFVSDSDQLSISTYDFSSNSSDFEALNLEEFDDLPVSDAFVSQILGESFQSEPDCSPKVDYNHQPNSNTLNSSSVKSKTKQSLDCTQSPKSWSGMSTREQEKTLVSISEVTCQMGIREQLDVIRIIDPHLKISANMTEFTLDLSLLNDSKWKRIKDYFKKYTRSLSLQNVSADKPGKSKKTQKVSKALTKKSSSVSRTSKKQRQKKQKIFSESDVKRLKEVKQGLKEEKSGLFVYEKVIKFSSTEEDEDVCINILE